MAIYYVLDYEILTLRSTEQHPAEDDEVERGGVVRVEVDDPVEPEGQQPPHQPRPQEHALRAEAVGEVPAEDLGECVAPEEAGEDGAHLGLGPGEALGGGGRHEGHGGAAGVDGGRAEEEGEEPDVLLTSAME